MSILRKNNIGSMMLLVALLLACSTGPTDDPIPLAVFPPSTLNLLAPEYSPLLQDGGYKIVSKIGANSVGVRGIILYRKNSTTYLAYEINCSYHPNDAASNVTIHASGLFMTCSGCSSNFDFNDGKPTGGVAWRPLRMYNTDLLGSNLTVTSDIVN